MGRHFWLGAGLLATLLVYWNPNQAAISQPGTEAVGELGSQATVSSGGMTSPLAGVSLQQMIDYQPAFGQSFGPKTGNQRSYGDHGGVDFDCTVGGCAGATVTAMKSGTVAAAEVIGSSANGASYRLVVNAEDGTEHRYVHVDSLTVSPGQAVAAGDVIAKVSPTDSVSTGPHLDIKILRGGDWVDPQQYMRENL